jgi:hypothetical protein
MEAKVTIKDLTALSKLLVELSKIRQYPKINTDAFGDLDRRFVEILFVILGFPGFIPKFNKTYIAKSKISGNGLFASTKINKGDIITLYPPHYIGYYKEGSYAGCKVGLLESDIVMQNKLKFDDTIWKYKMNINKKYAIYGDPRIIDCPAFLGHMINDGARGHSTKENYNHKDREIYNKITPFVNNSYYQFIENTYVVIIAYRNIEKDEEILMPYGYDYWIGEK